MLIFVLFKQKTAYEWRISDWSSDVCASDLNDPEAEALVTWRWHGLKPDLASKPVPSGEQDKQPDRQPPQGPVARGRGYPDRGGSANGGASCGETVGPDGCIAEVSDSCTKKNSYKTNREKPAYNEKKS